MWESAGRCYLARSKRRNQLKATEIIGKKVLILGEVGVGKTALTAKLIRELMLLVEPKEITVIDMAPEAIGEVGGKLSDYLSLSGELRYLSPVKVYAPRTMGVPSTQIIKYAKRNKKAIDLLLDEFLKNPTKVLIINDITLYLHSGKLEKILNCIKLAKTFLASAYYGVKLAEDRGTGIYAREKQLVERLSTHMNRVAKLKSAI
jgi:GTPase SAR1 family protein